MNRRNLIAFLALCLEGSVHAAPPVVPVQISAAIPQPAFVREAVLAQRDFPLLSALLNDPTARSLLANDTVLSRITETRWHSIQIANHDCKDDSSCRSKALRFTADETQEISASLQRLYNENALLRDFVRTKLKPISVYRLGQTGEASDLLIYAWTHSADSMNHIIDIYCDGVSPRYPAIDSMIYQPRSKSFAGVIRSVLDGLPLRESLDPNGGDRQSSLFFEPTLRFSLRLLQLNSRDEAGRFWPLQSGENAIPIKRLPSITWSKYPYSVILVPGEGPDLAGVALSPGGKERIRLAVQAYRSGLAPFIMVSGGYVHPSQTPFCEALEMKRYLLEIYGIHGSAILTEPYARHTTTNLRNAARHVFEYGLPSTIPMLVVSDAAQTDYIESADFLKRNQEELGYFPVTIGKRRSAYNLEAIPSRQSLYRDAADPLDP